MAMVNAALSRLVDVQALKIPVNLLRSSIARRVASANFCFTAGCLCRNACCIFAAAMDQFALALSLRDSTLTTDDRADEHIRSTFSRVNAALAVPIGTSPDSSFS